MVSIWLHRWGYETKPATIKRKPSSGCRYFGDRRWRETESEFSRSGGSECIRVWRSWFSLRCGGLEDSTRCSHRLLNFQSQSDRLWVFIYSLIHLSIHVHSYEQLPTAFFSKICVWELILLVWCTTEQWNCICIDFLHFSSIFIYVYVCISIGVKGQCPFYAPGGYLSPCSSELLCIFLPSHILQLQLAVFFQ